MRTRYSLINVSVGIGNQFIITLLSFISRTVFINTLGLEYLGVNGLFSNLLALLTLVEIGIGQSIIYSLYKPIAENNIDQINSLMALYKKAYIVIALVILSLGLGIMPFLDFFIKNTKVDHIYIIYLIFLINTVSPYLYVHKSNFLNACQKNYIVTGFYSLSTILSTCIKIGVLLNTHNYILYLVIDCIITISTSVILATFANKMYPFLKKKVNSKLDTKTRKEIIKNVKAIVLQNVGSYLVFGTDNILISSFVSIIAVGLYSNYKMLMDICRTFVNQIFNNIYHSIGNLMASESLEKIYSIYKVYRLLNFWLYSFFSISLYIIMEPFILIWIGKSYLLSNFILLTLVISFYERGMRNSITTIKTTAGIFHEDRFVPLLQAVVNLVVSIILVKHIGIAGIFIGTLLSALVGPFWVTPYLVYRKVFNESLIKYYMNYFVYIFIGLITFYVTKRLCEFVTSNSILDLILKMSICILVPNFLYFIIFYKTEEFKYLVGVIKKISLVIINKLVLNQKMST